MSKTIFISHSSKDKELVDIFVDTLLICGIEFSHKDIFCTSAEGLGIKTGEDWRNAIRENLIGSKVVILFITPNYKESEICLNEMGAAWTVDSKVIPIIVPPINFETIGVLFDVKQAIMLTKETDLDKLKDSLQEFASAEKIPTPRWTTKKQEAIATFKQKLEPSPFLTPLSRDVLTKIENELSEIKQAFGDIVAEKQNLSKLCERLKEAKDKNDVIAIEKDMGLFEYYDEFSSKAEEVGKGINQFDPIVRTIIFNEFTKKRLSITQDYRRSCEEELNNAIANNIIDEEENLNHKHPQVKKILSLLTDFESFFSKLSVEAYEKLADEYSDILFETDNLEFWKDVFGVERIFF